MAFFNGSIQIKYLFAPYFSPRFSKPESSIISFNPVKFNNSIELISLVTCGSLSQSSSTSFRDGESTPGARRKKKKRTHMKDVQIVRDDNKDSEFDENIIQPASRSAPRHLGNTRGFPLNMAMPNPPAGFVLDDTGTAVSVSKDRIASIVDSKTNLPLDCVIRRKFRSSQGDECVLLYPLDTPILMLKSSNVDGWSAIEDDEIEGLLTAASYALAKLHIHLVHSGYCLTARGSFCYSDDDIFDFQTDDGNGVDGLPNEGVEITSFQVGDVQYMIYTPSDPLLFVAFKDQNGVLQIADDDLLDDPAIIDVIDEETEFNALVEEEAAFLDSLSGKI